MAKTMRDAGVRVELLHASDSLGKRIRTVAKEKIPYRVVIGDNEIESQTISPEGRNDEKLDEMSVEEFINKIIG
jgi:threonyl-tRNA synthetase